MTAAYGSASWVGFVLASVTACVSQVATKPGNETANVPKAVTPAASSSAVGASETGGGATITPCMEGTTQHAAALAALEQLDSHVHGLARTGDPMATREELVSLLDGPCFKMALAEERFVSLEFDSALSIKTWWDDGGEAWLHHYLELSSNPPKKDRWSWIAPTPRKTLTKESAPKHALAPLLCSVQDAQCGIETTGWLDRATRAFDQHAKIQHEEAWGRGSSNPVPTTEECKTKAVSEPAAHRYETFRTCIEGAVVTSAAFPLGRFRSPNEGWLVLRGRRGHHSYCEETRAYDLASGASYVAQVCDAMSFVKSAKTGPVERTQIGRLPIENLREAAWMIFFAHEVQKDVLRAGYGVGIPAGVEPRRSEVSGLGLRGVGGWGSGWTTIEWNWVVGAKSIAKGTFTWPEAYDAADDHASHLLSVAEAAFVEGCAPVALPKELHAPTATPQETLLESLRKVKPCKPK